MRDKEALRIEATGYVKGKPFGFGIMLYETIIDDLGTEEVKKHIMKLFSEGLDNILKEDFNG